MKISESRGWRDAQQLRALWLGSQHPQCSSQPSVSPDIDDIDISDTDTILTAQKKTIETPLGQDFTGNFILRVLRQTNAILLFIFRKSERGGMPTLPTVVTEVGSPQ